MNKTLNWILVVFLVVVFLGLRLWRIEDWLNFSMDQGLFMIRAKEIWDNKEITLLGPTASPIFEGRQFFQGPIIYYSLIVLGLIANWDPVKISGLIVLGNLMAAFFLFDAIKTMINKKMAWIGLILFCFLPITVEFSNFVWNPNVLLIVSSLLLWMMVKKRWCGAGMVAGIGLQFHFQFTPIIGISLIYLFIKQRKVLLQYLTGLVIGYLPLIVFDIRNGFYNLNTIVGWALSGEKNRGIFVYDFLGYVPFLIGLFCLKVKPKIGMVIAGVVLIWSISWINQNKQSRWMPNNWTYTKLLKTAEIVQRSEGSFNVVNLLNGDSRFYSLRYLLKDTAIENVDNYSEIETLWVIGKGDDDKVINTNIYELNGFSPKIIERKYDMGDGINLYKLSKKKKLNKVVTIINPVRSRELWKDKSLKPIDVQYKVIRELDLKATWLIQNDGLQDEELGKRIKEFNGKQEVGVFLEVSRNLALRARVYFDEQRPWYDPGVVFLSAYEVNDREKLIDKMMTDFEKTFGYLPKSAGAWWIDSYSQQYLQRKYGIKTFLICADQKTTDSYGIWGQWWGYPYIPSLNNILVPGNSKAVVVQWAQRDLEKAYKGEGPSVSNYSLQANDYIRQKLDFEYFKKLATQYLTVEELGQITVGLETGMESVGHEAEYKKQLKWISDNRIESLKMSEFANRYRNIYGNKNPDKVIIGDWVLTPTYRENIKLGEKTIYSDKVFADYYKKDASGFLNRIYSPDNLIDKRLIDYEVVVKVLLVMGGGLIAWKFKKIKWWMIIIIVIVIWSTINVRYTVISGERIIGFLTDNLRFVGVNFKKGIVNSDLSNVVAKSMLKLKLDQLYFVYWVLLGAGLVEAGRRLNKTKTWGLRMAQRLWQWSKKIIPKGV